MLGAQVGEDKQVGQGQAFHVSAYQAKEAGAYRGCRASSFGQAQIRRDRFAAILQYVWQNFRQ